MLMQTLRYCRNFGLSFVALTLLFPLFGCGHDQLKEGRDQDSLDKFAAAYVKFRQALETAKVPVYAMLLDQGAPAADQNLTYYRSSYIKALSTKVGSKKRAEAAREAVEYFTSKSSPVMGSVLICPSHASRAASNVLRIHSETVCFLAFAAASTALIASP